MTLTHIRFTLAFLLAIGFAFAADISSTTAQTTVVDFESLPVPASGFYNGDPSVSGSVRDNFTQVGTRSNFGATEVLQLWGAGGASFSNDYTPDFGSYNGFVWSNVVDSSTPGFGNQYAAFPGGGSDGEGGANAGENYAITSGNGGYFNLPTQTQLQSVNVANTTYTYLAIRDGDDGPGAGFVTIFGGDSGNAPDYFSVTFTGYDQADLGGTSVGSVEHVLADYRFDDNSLDFVQDSWQNVDLSSLLNAQSVVLTFTTTDVGAFGANTPSYVALDNLTFTAIPEPGSLSLMILAASLLPFGRRR